jgi:hypothetical protein
MPEITGRREPTGGSADTTGNPPLPQPEAGLQSQVTTRKRLLSLLDQLEGASPFDSANLATEVRQQARKLRTLKQST